MDTSFLLVLSSVSDTQRSCELMWVHQMAPRSLKLLLTPMSLAASLLHHILPRRVTMPTGLGRGPGRQSALEAVSSSSVWRHANVCKWRGPAMTPAHRRNGPCPSQKKDSRWWTPNVYILKSSRTHHSLPSNKSQRLQ